MGWTPLHYVASKGKFKAVQQLLQHDISVAYDLDKEGQSALHIAAFLGYSLVIDEIVKFCPSAWDIINIKGQTALHVAVMGGEADVVKDILRKPNLECLIMEQDIDRNTALHLAALHKDYTIIDILARDKRVDRFITNKDHMTAFDIFLAHNEVGYSAAKVKYLLKESRGMSDFQGGVIRKIKKMSDKQFVEGQPGASIIIGSNIANRENSDSSIRNLINLQQLIATLIATVTFAATFTMPGGYNNDGPNRGMAILADRAAFKAFVVLNIIAFSFSVVALFIQFDPFLPGPSHGVRYTDLVGLCIFTAIWAMVLAFACGTYVVLTGTIGLGIFPFIIGGCIVIIYIIGSSLDRIIFFYQPPRFSGRYVRNLLFNYKILQGSW
ncbi:ankyrin repeat-containing protein ITN1 [Eucalyptus grandis]|uniref:ankyrin repeat-containing protein ITN1 n=1 Tax=Eucalyptus grandis TaxID=71139 RepID=UPI00192EF31F|nr:ankyrin repeat-containing protein ITN1 [Eucalyptus grandis]